VEVWLTNDLREEARHEAKVSLVDFRGKVLMEEALSARAPAGSAKLLRTYALSELAPRPEEVFLSVALTVNGAEIGNELFFTEPKKCSLPRAVIKTEIRAADKGYTVRLSSDAPAFYVCLSADGIPGEFDDNFFTLLRGSPRSVLFTPKKPVQRESIMQAVAVRHLRDTYR
jgi:beta-mannosidase